MNQIVEWLQNYSIGVVVLIALAAALIFVPVAMMFKERTYIQESEPSG